MNIVSGRNDLPPAENVGLRLIVKQLPDHAAPRVVLEHSSWALALQACPVRPASAAADQPNGRPVRTEPFSLAHRRLLGYIGQMAGRLRTFFHGKTNPKLVGFPLTLFIARYYGPTVGVLSSPQADKIAPVNGLPPGGQDPPDTPWPPPNATDSTTRPQTSPTSMLTCPSR